MKSYHLFIDRKSTIWIRDYVTIEANTLEEAIEKCKNGEYGDYNTEILYGTEEELTPDDNDGQATVEIYNSKESAPLWSNK